MSLLDNESKTRSIAFVDPVGVASPNEDGTSCPSIIRGPLLGDGISYSGPCCPSQPFCRDHWEHDELQFFLVRPDRLGRIHVVPSDGGFRAVDSWPLGRVDGLSSFALRQMLTAHVNGSFDVVVPQ